jgi:hypothetical protein
MQRAMAVSMIEANTRHINDERRTGEEEEDQRPIGQ